MRGVNKVIIIGNLGADPEARQFSNGGNVTNISVATSEQWTDKQSGEKREATEWHRVSLFNRLGEIAAQYLRKGSKVYIILKVAYALVSTKPLTVAIVMPLKFALTR